MDTFFIGIVVAAIAIGGGWLWLKMRKSNKSPAEINVFSTIEQLHAIGQLSAYRVMTKEIVTETDHSWGEIGKRYLSWVLSQKKMAMIFEFVIDFKYNLKDAAFGVSEANSNKHIVTMPPCDCEVNIKNIHFYDEQGAKLMPWLLPDLINGVFTNGFSEEDKNRLIDAAKDHAEKQAVELISSIQNEVQTSARATLSSISRAFGANDVEFRFAPQSTTQLSIEVSDKLVETTAA